VTVFVDTNVLVYARDSSESIKQPLAGAWMTHLWSSGTGRLSVQVLNEYYVNVTRLTPGLATAVARSDVDALRAWNPLPMSQRLVSEAWTISDTFGFSHWDSLIIAAASASGCTHLLTEDLQDGQVVGDIRVVNPFLHPPDATS
jgi:predicted nucleic acid-binding protein